MRLISAEKLIYEHIEHTPGRMAGSYNSINKVILSSKTGEAIENLSLETVSVPNDDFWRLNFKLFYLDDLTRNNQRILSIDVVQPDRFAHHDPVHGKLYGAHQHFIDSVQKCTDNPNWRFEDWLKLFLKQANITHSGKLIDKVSVEQRGLRLL